VADVLSEFADRLESAADRGDFPIAVNDLIASSYKAHRRVVFNGNGYSEEWAREAERRGLPRFRSAADAIPELASAQGVALFERQGVFTREEIESRCVIYLERYSKQVNIEAGVMLEMAKRSIFPAATACAEDFARASSALAAAGAPSAQQELRARKLAELAAAVAEEADKLERALAGAQEVEEPLARARGYREGVVPRMAALRERADLLEKAMDKARWPFPGYQELLFTL